MIEFDEIDENRLFSDHKNFIILKIGASWCGPCQNPENVANYKKLEDNLNHLIDFCEIDVTKIDEVFDDIYKHGDKFPTYKLISKSMENIENIKTLFKSPKYEKTTQNDFYQIIKEYSNHNLSDLTEDIGKIDHNMLFTR